MKLSIIFFELSKTLEKLEEDQLLYVKGGNGCPHDDDDDEEESGNG